MAVLGLLNEAPMHGYELRKRLNSFFGWGRALSYGSLYPCLKAMYEQGWISEHTPATTAPALPTVRRAKIVYCLTDRGEQRFGELLAEGGPSTWEDDNFGVHFAFFARTDITVRLRILEGRRRRLEERLEPGPFPARTHPGTRRRLRHRARAPRPRISRTRGELAQQPDRVRTSSPPTTPRRNGRDSCRPCQGARLDRRRL